MLIYTKIQEATQNKQKLLAVLIDPGKLNQSQLSKKLKAIDPISVDYIFLGGSLINQSIGESLKFIKSHVEIPVLLFPGSLLQLDFSADAMLLLSMLSGRNPELLIGNHVIAAPFIKKSGIEAISTAYLLIDGLSRTSVEYISNTQSIPREKTEIAVATAIAAELLGFKLVYLEAGSGARKSVPEKMILAVKENINIPLIVGGGIKTLAQLEASYKAGADLIVIGTAFEKNALFLNEAGKIKNQFLS